MVLCSRNIINCFLSRGSYPFVINRIMIRSNNNIIKSLFIGHHLALEVVTNRPFGLIPAIYIIHY